MSHATSQWSKLKQIRPLKFISTLAACTLMLGAGVQSGFGQSVAVAGARPSIISLAPSPALPADSIARRAGDATFEKPPANYHIFPATALGENRGTELLTLKFAGETTLNSIRSANKDFVIEPGSTCRSGDTYTYGQTCSLLVRFTPQGPGHRLGFVRVSHSADLTPASFGLTGNAYAPVVSFTPSVITTVPATVSGSTGTISGALRLAVDGGDVLYLADIGNNVIKEIDSSGALSTITPYFAVPAAVAVDSFGIAYSTNVSGSTYYFSYYTPWGTQSAYGYTYAAGSCTPGTPCPLSSVGLSSPANLSIDGYNNLFFEERTKGAAEMPVGNIAGGTGSFNLWYLSDQFAYANTTPGSFSVDAVGNLYTYYFSSVTNTCYLLQEPLYNAEYSPTANRVAGGTKCGFSGDGGQGRGAEISNSVGQIAFDVAGNLYFADAGNQRVRRIDAATGIIRTIAGNGTAGNGGNNGPATKATLRTPTGVAVDSQGQVYILSNSAATGAAQVVRQLGTTGNLVFPSTTQAVASATLIVNVANTGNSALNFLRQTLTGANAADFTIDNNATNCNFAAGNVLSAGQSCQIGVIFKPGAVGARAATINLVDNTLNAVNKITLSGTGVAAAKVSFTSTASTQTTTGTKVAVSVKVTSPYATPTGKVSFLIDGKAQTTAALTSATASAVIGPLPSGTHQLVANYSGDKNHAPAKATKTLTVK